MLGNNRCKCFLLGQKIFLRGVITQGDYSALFERQRDRLYDVFEESEATKKRCPHNKTEMGPYTA
ncbi:hypothetical protein ASC93_18365 [Massilia sp. Root335]|nr:hypothetical protein ASC93_18365 [Massilia sp. Root335]